MDNTDTSYSEPAAADPQRRLLLLGLLATCASLVVPFARVHAQPQSNPQYAIGTVAAPSSFIEVSRILTGRGSLDVAQGGRLYQALALDNAAFEGQHGQLLAFIKENQADATAEVARRAEVSIGSGAPDNRDSLVHRHCRRRRAREMHYVRNQSVERDYG
jgi:hypothetical protein